MTFGAPEVSTPPSARRRIVRSIERAARRRIAIVTGRAGSGKSAALRAFAARSCGCIGFRLRSEHATPAAFARGLVEALDAGTPRLGPLLSAAYTSVRRRDDAWDALAEWLGSAIAGPVTIVVDQLERAPDPEVVRFLVRAIEASPRDVRWILGMRASDAYPLARWLAERLADIAVDDDALRVGLEDVPELARAFGRSGEWVERLRLRYHGSIGAIAAVANDVDGVCDDLADHRAALATLAALGPLDEALEAVLDDDAAAALAAAKRTTPPAIVRRADGRFAYDEAVAWRMLSLASDAERLRGRLAAGRALERGGSIARALQCYVWGGSRGETVRMLDEHGFELLDGGSSDIVAAAIATLPADERRRSALALTLEATDESYRGRHDISESWFQHAIAIANDAQKPFVSLAYAVDLLRRNRPDAVEKLEALATTLATPASEALAMGSLATAYARANRSDDANAAIARALAARESVSDLHVRATISHRAAYVALQNGNFADADAHAERAATLAREHGNHEIVAIARSVSYVVAISDRDDHERALGILSEIFDAGKRLGNSLFQSFALFGTYLIRAERGEHARLRELDASIASAEFEAGAAQLEEGYLPVRALRQTWVGDFAGAYNTIAPSGEHETIPESRALRWAEIALYAAAASYRDTATAAISISRAALRAAGAFSSVETLRTRLWLALASLLLGRRDASRKLLAMASDELARFPRLVALHATIDALSRNLDRDDPSAMLEHLDRLQTAGFGGFATMIAMIPATWSSRAPSKRTMSRAVFKEMHG